jgi:hypothetical protein
MATLVRNLGFHQLTLLRRSWLAWSLDCKGKVVALVLVVAREIVYGATAPTIFLSLSTALSYVLSISRV